MISVSVVVPTYRRPGLLGRCLTALKAQDLREQEFEVLIVDDANLQETRTQVENFAKTARMPVRYVPVLTEPHGPATARNIGWRAARGKIIAFTDDDTVPDPSWLSGGVAAFQPNVIAIWGRLIMPGPRAPAGYARDAAELERAEFATSNCFCRKEVLEAVGGFDERFIAAWQVDSDLFFSLLKYAGERQDQNLEIIHAPEAIVIHPIRPTPWGMSLKQQRKSMYNALLYKKHPDLYRKKIQPGPPWRYYVTTLILIALALSTVQGDWSWAVAWATLWFFLTLSFCIQRLRDTARTPSHIAEMAVTSALIPFLAVYWRIRGAIKFRVLFL